MDPRAPSPPGGEPERGGGESEHGGASEAGGTPDIGGMADEALRRLELRLDRASDAAERLLAEAAGSAARAARAAAGAAGAAGAGDTGGGGSGGGGGGCGGRGATGNAAANEPPPAGWQVPPTDSEQQSRRDLELLGQFVQSLRDLIPLELQRRLTEALRELLLAIRAVIDWYLERADRARAAPTEVQDIPIA